MEKIRYRLVYNRKKQLNRQGTALVQVECRLNGRKIYFKTDLYLKPECWDRRTSQVCCHPQADDLNTMLYEFVLRLQEIELAFWKRGAAATLSLLKEAVRKNKPVNVSFIPFARNAIQTSDKKKSTKSNLLTTVTLLQEFRPGMDFADITYTFLKDFEAFLRGRGCGVNTTAKHMRQLRTLVNEAINSGYIHADAYPFRKFRIKQEKGRHEFLTPAELRRLERLDVEDGRLRHVLDAFLFCCYTGLRISDFRQVTASNLVREYGKVWLHFRSVKTDVETRLPLHLMFDGKALDLLARNDPADFFRLPAGPDANKSLSRLISMAGIRKHATWHSSRHTCAVLLIHQGVPITTVQKLLGHTSVRTTEIYSEVMTSTVVRDLKGVRKRRRKDVVKAFPQLPML